MLPILHTCRQKSSEIMLRAHYLAGGWCTAAVPSEETSSEFDASLRAGQRPAPASCCSDGFEHTFGTATDVEAVRSARLGALSSALPCGRWRRWGPDSTNVGLVVPGALLRRERTMTGS